MKRAFTPMSISAVAVCLTVLVYAFSFPLAVYLTLWYLPRDFIPYVETFYQPANEIAVRCPPYLAILEWETRQLGVAIHYNLPATEFPR